MTRPNSPHDGMRSILRGKFLTALVLLAATALFVAGCKKSSNTGNTSNSGTANSTSQSNETGNDNTAVLKDMADKQGQATKPDKGNFSVQYSPVQNQRYAQLNESFRKQHLLENIAD